MDPKPTLDPSETKTVVLASHNPVKIRAARNGFEACFPTQVIRVEGITVSSGVSSQPMTDTETLRGAENRVARAEEQCPEADFWVGMEGGIHADETDANTLVAFAWVVVRSPAARMGRSRTATFPLPEKIAELVRAGVELGEADDRVFRQTNSKKRNGAVGLLTGNLIDRAGLYEPSVILALIPFLNPELYPSYSPRTPTP